MQQSVEKFGNGNEGFVYCEACKLWLNGLNACVSHLTGTKHKKKKMALACAAEKAKEDRPCAMQVEEVEAAAEAAAEAEEEAEEDKEWVVIH